MSVRAAATGSFLALLATLAWFLGYTGLVSGAEWFSLPLLVLGVGVWLRAIGRRPPAPAPNLCRCVLPSHVRGIPRACWYSTEGL